ncbi:hypothetical protein B0H13DRAFT_1896702 [Mycena leptocephala]|nr:hypothetical protein B0H13DRAFT_1896702 [Mycena leptocephala]
MDGRFLGTAGQQARYSVRRGVPELQTTRCKATCSANICGCHYCKRVDPKRVPRPRDSRMAGNWVVRDVIEPRDCETAKQAHPSWHVASASVRERRTVPGGREEYGAVKWSTDPSWTVGTYLRNVLPEHIRKIRNTMKRERQLCVSDGL